MMFSNPNPFDDNLSFFPEETTDFAWDTSPPDSLDAYEPEAVELPDAMPLDPMVTLDEIEIPGSQRTDPFDASATGIQAEPSATPDFNFGASGCSHCGEHGYTTSPGSDSPEPCYYCNGSGGVSHDRARFGFSTRQLPCGHTLSCTEPEDSHHCHGTVRFSGKWEYWGNGVYYERGPDGGFTGKSSGYK